MTQKYFRSIGKLPFQYFGFSQDIYETLVKTKQIEKLENMYQLGSIKDVYDSEHRRSEYVKIQIALLTKLTCDSKGKGLGSNLKEIDFKISRAEVLQSLVLLHNIGHMIGTFCNEAGLLKELQENKALKSKFRSTLKGKIAKELFDEVLNSWDTNSFYKVLIYFNIAGLSISSDEKIKIYKILDWHFDKTRDNDSVDDIYKMVRIISFLYLDLENSFIPLSLPIDQITKSWEENTDAWFDRSSIEIKFIQNMYVSISELLYYNEKVAPYKVYSYNKAKEYFKDTQDITELRNKIKNIELFTYTQTPKSISFVFETDYVDEQLLDNKNIYIEKFNDKSKISVTIQNNLYRNLAPILYNHLNSFSKNEFESFVKVLFNNIFTKELILNFKYLDDVEFLHVNKGSKATVKIQ